MYTHLLRPDTEHAPRDRARIMRGSCCPRNSDDRRAARKTEGVLNPECKARDTSRRPESVSTLSQRAATAPDAALHCQTQDRPSSVVRWFKTGAHEQYRHGTDHIAPARRTLWQQGGRNEHWVAPGAMYGRVARGNRMSAGKRRAMEREDRIWWQEKCVWRRRYRRRSAPCALEVTEPSSGLD